MDNEDRDLTPAKESQIIVPHAAEPVRIAIGNEYRYTYNSEIIKVRIEKIQQDTQGNVAITFSRAVDKGFGRNISTVSAQEFKVRVLAGGVEEILL